MNQLTTIFKLLSDESRLRIMMLLFQQDLCVCEISGILEMPQPKVSKNLAKLRDLNLVSDERREKFVSYSLKKDDLILMQILQQIMTQMDQYPQLKLDSSRIVEKDKYLNQCYVIFKE